ncbi:hypothetical protein NFHSH190041_15500 [Shewanella sp. NFH-SH190041]|uniref:hypothetical protein n=1 Tax=Shewanella sp. NFH-SH190041 TaxID=2950245 RepID=UPI0021C42770|nr:hypothetical protein [Shewanella sp. NFH-SH190041]BDM64098.1 hypothetical protein NFHSH190041_15500 [Shewanella sp. NFH-SH190041]
MQINSLMSAGVAGIQYGRTDVTRATIDVAMSTHPNNTPNSAVSSQAAEVNGENGQQLAHNSNETMIIDSTQSVPGALISAGEAAQQVQASAGVVSTGSENLGTLVDIQV